MIRQLGVKRIVIIISLFCALCAGLFFSLVVFGPQRETNERKLSTVKSELSTLQGEIDTMRTDYAAFEERKETFDRITRIGFFNDQNRLTARERLDTIRTLSKVILARYEIKAAKVTPDTDALGETGYVMMETPVSLNLSALDDLDIYRFLYYLTYGFPGHISIETLSIQRVAEITPDVLKAIGTGSPPEIVNATLELTWKTLARKDAMESNNATTPVSNAIVPLNQPVPPQIVPFAPQPMQVQP